MYRQVVLSNSEVYYLIELLGDKYSEMVLESAKADNVYMSMHYKDRADTAHELIRKLMEGTVEYEEGVLETDYNYEED